MKILEGLNGLRAVPAGSVLSIGNFDGVHRGHQRLLQLGRELRAATSAEPAPASLAVATFEPHPLTVLRPADAPPRLTPIGMKRALLAEQGVDLLVELPPAPQILGLSAEQFWQIVRDDVRPRHLIEGPSFNFGKDRRGTIDALRAWTAAGSSVRLHVLEPVGLPLLDMLQVPVSSSIIRWLLANGRVRDAARCLGRSYVLAGQVVPGARRGRELGFPTANLACDAGQMVPADGVYAGRVALDDGAYVAAVSIGTNPTFGQSPRTIEAHLIDFHGDLYGRTLRLAFIDWLRDQWTFRNVDALQHQIARDVAHIADRVARHAAHAVPEAL